MHASVCIYLCVGVQVCGAHLCRSVCRYICMCACMHMGVCACVYVCASVCVCVHVGVRQRTDLGSFFKSLYLILLRQGLSLKTGAHHMARLVMARDHLPLPP